MTEEAKLIVETLRYCEESGARCGGCPSGVLRCLSPSKIADLIESLSEQLEQTENKLSELLSYATGGRFSKADYSIDDMRRFVDDYNQSECNECDQLEDVNNERDGLNIMLAQAQAMLETRTRERDAAVRDLREADRINCEHCIAYMQYSTNCDEADYICADCDKMCRCRTCRNNSNWQWRGVEVEEC